ncbi:MAG: M23 family metallopeptidase [Oscillochloridaceae bacterium umkhey_bin13]
METLRTLRRTRALTLLDLAALTGIPARTLAEAEYGLRRLGVAEREMLALVLGLNSQDLTGAHPRMAPGAAEAMAIPWPDQRTLQALVGLALVATVTTGSLELVDRLPEVSWSQFDVTSSRVVNETQSEPGRQGALADLDLQPLRPEARELGQVRLADWVAQANTTREALAPPLLVAPTPGDDVAPAPLPVIEAVAAFRISEVGPLGCPVVPLAGQVVLTQGYGVGSHAPAAVWGAIDLAVDGNGDGYADQAASWYQPIVATHDGRVTVTLDSYPGGNYVAVSDPSGVWRTGYGHLALVTVLNGQFVRAGEQIGLMGSTGASTGPHLDYQVWRSGVNIDPTELVGCGHRGG